MTKFVVSHKRGSGFIKAQPVQKVEIVKHQKRSGYGSIQRKPFKDHVIVKMSYAEMFKLATTTGAYNEYIYRLNSIFDPDFTGVGHQPYGFDTYSTIYSKYRVLKVKWHITGQMDTTVYSTLTVLPNNSLTSVGSSSLAMETPRSKYKQLVGPGGTPVEIRGTLDLASFNGRSKAQYSADDLFEATMTTNPNEVMGLHIGLSNLSGVTGTFSGNIVLEYTVELFDPLQLAQS